MLFFYRMLRQKDNKKKWTLRGGGHYLFRSAYRKLWHFSAGMEHNKPKGRGTTTSLPTYFSFVRNWDFNGPCPSNANNRRTCVVQGSEPAKGKQISERSRVWNYSQLKSRLLRLPPYSPRWDCTIYWTLAWFNRTLLYWTVEIRPSWKMPPDPNNKRKIETKLTVSVVSERIDGLLFELGILLTHVEWKLFYYWMRWITKCNPEWEYFFV